MVKTVAIFNASDDTVAMLSVLLSEAGYRVVSGQVDEVKSGAMDFIAFMDTHQPDAIIWDIAPPYDRNWTFFKLLRSIGPLANRAIVLTTTSTEHLESVAGKQTGAIELVGKPYDLNVIVAAVARGMEQQTQRGPAGPFGLPKPS